MGRRRFGRYRKAMSQKIFSLLRQMDIKDSSLQLALQCAPFLAGLKVSNLLILPSGCGKNLLRQLKKAGISVRVLYRSQGRITFLLYRRAELAVAMVYGHENILELNNKLKGGIASPFFISLRGL